MLHLIHSTKSPVARVAEQVLVSDYAEASYFDGYHFQHIADWEQAKRTKRLNDRAYRIVRERRYGSRSR